MTPRIVSLISFLLLPALASAANPVLLKKVSGTVEFKTQPEAAWSQAQPGAQIPSGGQVRTGADGRAELRFQNKSTVWLKPATSVAVDQKGPRHQRIVLGSGALKVRVPHLRYREKFEIKTAMAVASVRGTVFSIDEKKVQTFFGQVNMLLEDGKKIEVPQGNGWGATEGLGLLSQMDESLGLEDWTPGLSDDERQEGLKEFVENRREIHAYADDALARNSELVDALADRVKDNDFAAGRTLTDVHGNLVRVEQRLDRPNPHTIQVLNVTLRKEYNSGGLRRFTYNGGNGPRVDAVIAKTEFSEDLPDNINEFPAFFSAREDSLKINYASLITANLSDPDNITTIAFLGERAGGAVGDFAASRANPEASEDDIESTLYVGKLDSRADLFNLNSNNVLNHADMGQYQDANADAINRKGLDGELYSSTAKKFVWGGLGRDYGTIWICAENYVINNAGQVRNVSDFTGGGTNIQDLLSDTAGQSVVFVKVDGLGAPSGLDALPGSQNIDVVFIPDLFLSIVKSLASSADTFKTTY